MRDFVKRIEQTNYKVLGSTECLVCTNHFNEQSQWLEFMSSKRRLAVLPVRGRKQTI